MMLTVAFSFKSLAFGENFLSAIDNLDLDKLSTEQPTETPSEQELKHKETQIQALNQQLQSLKKQLANSKNQAKD